MPLRAHAFLTSWTRSTAFSLVALAHLALLPACRERGRDEREATLRDQAALEQIINRDLELDRIMKDADDLASRGDPSASAELLETRARPAADAALAAASTAVVASPWAQGRRDALVALAQDRRREIPRYAGALRANDLDAKLGAVQAQVLLQRRAMQLAASIAQGPDHAPDAG